MAENPARSRRQMCPIVSSDSGPPVRQFPWALRSTRNPPTIPAVSSINSHSPKQGVVLKKRWVGLSARAAELVMEEENQVSVPTLGVGCQLSFLMDAKPLLRPF